MLLSANGAENESKGSAVKSKASLTNSHSEIGGHSSLRRHKTAQQLTENPKYPPEHVTLLSTSCVYGGVEDRERHGYQVRGSVVVGEGRKLFDGEMWHAVALEYGGVEEQEQRAGEY